MSLGSNLIQSLKSDLLISLCFQIIKLELYWEINSSLKSLVSTLLGLESNFLNHRLWIVCLSSLPVMSVCLPLVSVCCYWLLIFWFYFWEGSLTKPPPAIVRDTLDTYRIVSTCSVSTADFFPWSSRTWSAVMSWVEVRTVVVAPHWINNSKPNNLLVHWLNI